VPLTLGFYQAKVTANPVALHDHGVVLIAWPILAVDPGHLIDTNWWILGPEVCVCFYKLQHATNNQWAFS
jgi:hypothetical protein